MEERLKSIRNLIAEVEKDIAMWRKHESQSNPSAVAELREMTRELKALERIKSELLTMLQEQTSGPR